MNLRDLPNGWGKVLAGEFEQPYMRELQRFVADERAQHQVFPDEADVFAAMKLTPLKNVRVVILGQDPYHDVGQAHGLSFSVARGMKIPPSLRNIFRELNDDLGIAPASHGCLDAWAKQGVLLLNTVLTVRAHQANSHRGRGWETFTDHIIDCVNELPNVVFVLWGRPAQKKESRISQRHLRIASAHPSPLSARRGFFGSRPFSRANEFLIEHGRTPVDWRLD